MESVLVTIVTDEGETLFEMSYGADVTEDPAQRDRLLRDVAEALQ